MKLFKYLLCILAIGFSLNAFAAVITEDGKPSAAIMLDQKAPDCARRGAAELQDFVKQMSGATLPIIKISGNNIEMLSKKYSTIILLGDTAATQKLGLSTDGLKSDGYHILIKGNKIAVVGKDAKYYDQIASRAPMSAGTLYGVYRLLEMMGIRFYQQDNTIIPQEKTIKLEDANITSNPYFPYRITEVMVDPWFRRIGYGGDRDPWASRHSFHYWYKRFAKTHPEYFCLDENGESDGYYPAFTHDGVIEQMIADAKSHFSRKSLPDGKRRYFQVLANDYFMKMCSCDKCQALVTPDRPKIGWYSDYVGQAVVKVANAVKKDFPDCYIVYGAYERYQLPPTKIKKLPDNVVVQIASLRRATRPHWMSAEDTQLLKEWQELQPAGIYFWRYYTYGKKGVPWVMPHVIAKSIKTMKKYNEEGKTPILGEMHFFRRDPRSRWWQNVNDYVSAKMLWDPNLDCDELLDDYCSGTFGPAAKQMREFFNMLEENYMTYSDSGYIPKKLAFELEAKLKESLSLAAGTEYAKRIRYIKHNFIALQKCLAIYKVEDQDKTAPIKAGELAWAMKDGRDKSVMNHHVKITKQGLYFNGKDSYLQLKKPITVGDSYTLESWICPDELEIRPVIYGESFNTFEPYYIFGSKMNNPTYNNIGFAIVGKCLFFNDVNLGKVKSKPLEFEKGEWYHVVAVMDRKNNIMAIYLDGKLVGIETIITTMINHDPSKSPPAIRLVGAGADNASKLEIKGCRGFFNGMMKNARIYNKALTAEQILGRSKEN